MEWVAKKMIFNYILVVGAIVFLVYLNIIAPKHKAEPQEIIQNNKVENSNQDIADETEGWKEFVDTNFNVSFKYPENFGTRYLSSVDWPPEVNVVWGPFGCIEAGEEIDVSGKTTPITINGNSYCVTEVLEGAAGSTYGQYAFAKTTGDETTILVFSIRYVECANYNEPQKTECEIERKNFDINPIIDVVFSTLKKI